MGTRNLSMVVKDGEYKVVKYCQWDGYPSGQGAWLLDFLKERFDKDIFVKKLNNIELIDANRLKELWVSCGASPDDHLVSFEVSEKFSKEYPSLHRDMGGADLFDYILNSNNDNPVLIYNDDEEINFAANSLFCEWAYVVDLDKNTFEVYKGFNKTKLEEGERFYHLNSLCKNGYYPVKLVKSYSLDSLPYEEDFINDLEKDD